MEEKKYKEEMDMHMSQMPSAQQADPNQLPIMQPMYQAPVMSANPHMMPQMMTQGMPSMPMMCCPYLMNMQCPMMASQYSPGVSSMFANPNMMAYPNTMAYPNMMAPYMYNPMGDMQY